MNANELAMCPILLPDYVPLMNYILHCKEDNVVDDRGSHTQYVGQLSQQICMKDLTSSNTKFM